MQTKNPSSKTTSIGRTAAIIEIETRLIQRFHDFLNAWTIVDQHGQTTTADMACIGDFVDTFVDGFHLIRVEQVLDACVKAKMPRIGFWRRKLWEFQDKLRDRLESMKRSARAGDKCDETSFIWSAKLLRRDVGQYLEWIEDGLLPKMRATILDALDQKLIKDLELDQANEVSVYAQAEGLLLTLDAKS